MGVIGELLECPVVALVELQEHSHLEGGGLQSVLVPEAVGGQFTLGHVVEPVEFAACMEPTVEICKTINTAHEF